MCRDTKLHSEPACKSHHQALVILNYEINFYPDISKNLSKYNIDNIENQIELLFKFILKSLNIDCFDNDDRCLKCFGADIMIDDNYNIKFIELNSSPQFIKYKNLKYNYEQIILNFIVENLLDNIFLNKPIKKEMKLIKEL